MGTQPGGEAGRAVERRLRNWALAGQQEWISAPADTKSQATPFVTISRTMGAAGSEVAHMLGTRLGWPVYDREILQAMAGNDEARARLYEQIDERDASWVEETLHWMLRGEVPKEDYFYRLTEAVLAIHRQGPAVFLGRASDLILPRGAGLRLRLDAAVEVRAKRVAARLRLTTAEALRHIQQTDRDHAEFRRHHFGRVADDLNMFDLIINMEHFTSAQAVEITIAALRAPGLIT